MELRGYLVDRKEDIKNVDVKPRKIKFEKTKDFVTSVIGPRRAGKTYFLYHLTKSLRLQEEDYLFVNFEEIFEPINILNLPIIHKELYGKLPDFIFFDEIQALGKWEKQIYSLYEKKRYHIFITGSSSKLLSKEIVTQLRGRTVTTKIFPFSFKEILEIAGISGEPKTISSYEEGSIKHVIKKHLLSQFPDVVLGNINPRDFFRDYLSLVIYRDIIERYGIKNRYMLELFLRSVIDSNCREFSVHKLYNSIKSQGIKVSKKTLYNFQKILEDVMVVYFLKKFSRGLRKRELTIPKVYLTDPGLYNYLVEKDFSKSMENAVFLELIKGSESLGGFEGFDAGDVFYYKTRDGREVDFLIRKDSKLVLIEVAYSMDEEHIRKVRKAMEELNLKRAFIVTWDEEDVLVDKGREIRITPFWKMILVGFGVLG